MKIYLPLLFLYVIVALSLSCKKDDTNKSPESNCKWCSWVESEETNCRIVMGEYCDAALIEFENGEGYYSVHPIAFPDGFPKCYETESAAKEECIEYYYNSYTLNDQLQYLTEERFIGQYCFPLNWNEINADVANEEQTLAEGLNIEQEVELLIVKIQRCL